MAIIRCDWDVTGTCRLLLYSAPFVRSYPITSHYGLCAPPPPPPTPLALIFFPDACRPEVSSFFAQAFDEVKGRTSIVPFQAILEGRQQLPQDYYREWLRLPYLTILFVTLGAYWAHPLMQRTAYWLNW